LTALQHLDLCYNRINDAGAASLSAVLPQLTALEHLDLFDNRINDAGS
jgi:Leucine-rich repeat (LRR) protein